MWIVFLARSARDHITTWPLLMMITIPFTGWLARLFKRIVSRYQPWDNWKRKDCCFCAGVFKKVVKFDISYSGEVGRRYDHLLLLRREQLARSTVANLLTGVLKLSQKLVTLIKCCTNKKILQIASYRLSLVVSKFLSWIYHWHFSRHPGSF